MLRRKQEQKTLECDKAVLGYDPTKWQKTDAIIRSHGEQEYTFERLKIPPPVFGLHKYAYCKGLYRDVHRFMANRSWTPTSSQSSVSGVTWLELFILFDVSGARTVKGEHIKDPKAKHRADARNKKAKKDERQGTRGNPIAKPSLDEELKRFKAIVRHIAKQELGGEQGKSFLMEKKSQP